ncbi:glycoside hydrolase family 15 [Candidatus Woesearchaeota archaeon]|nr:glycoside hydrolase family 15 [Candidatus Woesearchaeota archaeon]
MYIIPGFVNPVYTKELVMQSVAILIPMRYPNGLFAASANSVNGYDKVWIRDNAYVAMGLDAAGHPKEAVRTLQSLLDILLKHESKIGSAIREKPQSAHQYIHPRYNPHTLEEIPGEWGNSQNDSIGVMMFEIADLESRGIKVLRNEHDRRILGKLVDYLVSIQYWHDKDQGMWEVGHDLHASSIGACVGGLSALQRIIPVDSNLIANGYATLDRLLPRESEGREVDMALLSLMYPYNILAGQRTTTILDNIERSLVKENGVVRFLGDDYDNRGEEARWSMGLPWIAIAHSLTGKPQQALHYLRKTVGLLNEGGELPELYYADTGTPNKNIPLAWAHAMLIIALQRVPLNDNGVPLEKRFAA